MPVCHAFGVPGTDLPGGDPAGPPVLGFASPDRPPPGTLPPTASGSGSLFLVFQLGCLKKALASSPAETKNSEEWLAICLQIVRRYRNRPEGGMPATEYYARACEVESDLCPARRRRGKRALLMLRQLVSICLVACDLRSLNVLILLLPGKLHKGLL